MDAWMLCGCTNDRKVLCWSPPPNRVLKFNVDGAAKNKQCLAGIGGVLHNSKGGVLCM